MHSMQAGYLEKAQKYTDKALMQLEKLKSECAVCCWHTQRAAARCLLGPAQGQSRPGLGLIPPLSPKPRKSCVSWRVLLGGCQAAPVSSCGVVV